MKLRTVFSGITAAAAVSVAVLAPASSASATSAEPGTTSLAEVLTSDGNQFDRNKYDYDIVTEAVLAVLAAKPESPVGLLADGSVPLTAFIPNDFSFKVLAKDLTGHWPHSEQAAFEAIAAAVGIDAIETVLLYHVVPGAAIDSAAALQADGVALTTAQGGTFTVKVVNPDAPFVRLKDNDPNDVDPFLAPRKLDINKGNLQIAHGIWFVLRPIDL
jgi:uncharacterized surface protein with fasciclin (FAS1) repeats